MSGIVVREARQLALEPGLTGNCSPAWAKRMRHWPFYRWIGTPAGAVLFAAMVLVGCTGIPQRSETEARGNLNRLRDVYDPANRRSNLPLLDTNATLGTLLTFAMFNQPRIASAYYDYAEAVERITVARSLPDPRLTLELDIQDVVMTLMPGLMAEVPWAKKLRIRADINSADSQAKYFAFESAVLQTAFEVKSAYYQLFFLDERLRLNRDMLRLVTELETIARAQVASSKVTLQDVLRAQIEQERLRTEIANLEDSRNPLLARLKGALGLSDDQPNPPVPQRFESTPFDLTPEELHAKAVARNPRLREIEAEVQMAEAGIRLAHQSGLPDFNVGLEADAKASPLMWRPGLGVTLPIWRDKIAAEIAAAQARKSAAQARLSAEQIRLAVEYAEKSFTYREARRNLVLLRDTLLPKARQSLEVARTAYSSGKTDFINLIDAERALLEFQLAEVDARTRRELALAELSLLIAGLQPRNAPVLGPAGNARSSTLF